MGALPMADITIYYIDIRAFGKGYDEFYEQAKGMGVKFIKGKIGKISELENGSLTLRYEDIQSGRIKEAEHDLVVLSVGVLANKETSLLFKGLRPDVDKQDFILQGDPVLSPARTTIDGIFVAGTASGPKDIPDSILSAGSAAAEALSYLTR